MMRSDTSLLFVFALVLVSYVMISQVVERVRMQRLGWMCAGQGEVLIDNNMGGPAKCWNPKTTLMHEPTELLRSR